MTRQELKDRVESLLADTDQPLVTAVLDAIDEYCNELTKDVTEIAEILRAGE